MCQVSEEQQTRSGIHLCMVAAGDVLATDPGHCCLRLHGDGVGPFLHELQRQHRCQIFPEILQVSGTCQRLLLHFAPDMLDHVAKASTGSGLRLMSARPARVCKIMLPKVKPDPGSNSLYQQHQLLRTRPHKPRPWT